MKSWPHAPSKVVIHPGIYFITASTEQKQLLFNTPEKLDILYDTVLSVAEEMGWELQAWAFLANHYHLLGFSPPVEQSVEALTRKAHGIAARELNQLEGKVGRVVWYRSWDTRISFEKSYLARLAYVHQNPVKHGLTVDAEAYPWCSAKWFRETTDRSFYETVMSFRVDKVNVYDPF